METMRKAVAGILWRRLDTPGHDACRLEGDDRGWYLDGTAVFMHDGRPARLSYQVACDRAWRTRHGQVRGWVGLQPMEVQIARPDDGTWVINDKVVPGLGQCVDLDLGFTPATNLLSIRRLALAVGQAADVAVTWLDVSAETLVLLPQHYARRTGATYWYESPTSDDTALLEITPAGFVSRYPDLWETDATF
jgi:uncharacterized protein